LGTLLSFQNRLPASRGHYFWLSSLHNTGTINYNPLPNALLTVAKPGPAIFSKGNAYIILKLADLTQCLVLAMSTPDHFKPK
jgi:hypothetical protein